MNEDNNIEFFEDEVELSSTLSELEGVNSFRVPVGYFDNLENDIIQKVEINQSRTKTFSIFRKAVYYVAAASVIFVLGYIAFNMYSKDTKSKIVKTDDIEHSLQNIDRNNKQNHDIPKYSLGKNVDTINNNVQIVENKNASLNIEDNTIVPNSADNKIIVTQQKNNSIEVVNDDIDNSIINNDNVSIENNSKAIAINTSQNINNNSSTTVRSARMGSVTVINTFLPSDTCVNKPFVYDIKSLKIKYPKWNFQWEGEKPGDNCSILSSKSYVLHYWLGDSISLYDTMQVKLEEKPNPKILAVSEICSYNSVLVKSGISSNEYDYYWSVSDKNSPEILLENLKPGNYHINLKVTSCVDTVASTFVLHVLNCNISVPNVFTPNGDGYNDYFVVKGLENYPGSTLRILDRNGKVVYQSLDYKNNWGADNIPQGTYFYSLKIKDQNNTEKGGIISIIK